MTERAIAFHLPQFHPIAENDEWWGKGFTEWTNMVKAKPLFKGHYQPHFPADLGFYDLRVREAQAELAKAHGISGFCYYHYWFQGRRLLGRPVDEILRSGWPDFPFCLCWANESWRRGWLGQERDVLISRTYDPYDDLQHCHWLAEAFVDHRYLRMKGRAVFLIYRPGHLPEPRRLTDTLRDACIKNGDENPYASAGVFRKSAYERAGGADESIRTCGDWKLWAGLALEGRVAYLSEPLNYFRFHDKSVRNQCEEVGLDTAEKLQVVRWVLTQVKPTETVLQKARLQASQFWIPAVLNKHFPIKRRLAILGNAIAI